MNNANKVFRNIAFSFFIAILALAGQQAAADTVDVEIIDFAFVPQTVTVGQGTTVRWTNSGAAAHTTTSTTSVWNSGTLNTGATFSFTFTTIGTFNYFCQIHPFMTGAVVVQAPTDVGDDSASGLPNKIWLAPNYPNPFNPSTTIEYSLPEQAHVTISVYNVVGQLVRILVDGEKSAGNHSTQWDATDMHGLSVPTGVYFYRLEADGNVQTRKMMLMK